MGLHQRLLWGLSLLALTACATVKSYDGARYRVGSAAFRSYLEQVFRLQNQTVDELAFAQEDLILSRADTAIALSEAEARLLKACSELNRLAVSRRDQTPMGRAESLVAARSVAECERASHAGQEILRALQ